MHPEKQTPGMEINDFDNIIDEKDRHLAKQL
jgi:hypothetical protein